MPPGPPSRDPDTGDDELPSDQGLSLPLPLRLLALLGALSYVLIGLSSLVPLLRPAPPVPVPEPQPASPPEPRQGPVV